MSHQKILHITFNMGFGGTEQVICQLVVNLPAAQFSNEILCIDGEVGRLGETLKSEHGITIHTLQRQPGLDWRLALKIRRLILEGGFDIVHCHQYTPWFYGWMARLCTRVKLVFTEHGRFYPDKHRRKAWLVNKIMARSTDGIVAISEATRNALTEFEYLPLRRIHVIYNGIEPLMSDANAGEKVKRSLGIPEDAFVVGTVARLDPVKNQRMMIEAVHALRQSQPRIYLLLVGDGPARKELEDLSSHLGIRERVIFTGFQNQPVTYLRAMDVFLLTSDTEGTSMTLLESMSLAKPSIVTAVGGNSEIVVANRTGLFIKAGDAKELAARIKVLQHDPSTRETLGEEAYQRFLSSFSAAIMTRKYQELFKSHAGGCQ